MPQIFTFTRTYPEGTRSPGLLGWLPKRRNMNHITVVTVKIRGVPAYLLWC